MTKHGDTATTGGPPVQSGDGVAQRLRRLERRLARAHEAEAKRARKLERARHRGAAQSVVAARRRKLLKARERGHALERKLARAQGSAGSVSSSPDRVGSSPDSVGVVDGPRAYCLRERRTIVMADPQETVMRNGRPALAGRCPSCGMRVVRPVRSPRA